MGYYFQGPRIPQKAGRGAMIILGLFALPFLILILILIGIYAVVAFMYVAAFFSWLFG